LLVVVSLGVFATPAFGWFEVPEKARESGAVHEGKPRVDARLITDARQVAPGETFRVGVAFSMESDWHIYWQNPGDAGVPTDIEWGGDEVSFGPLKWSAPKRFTESGGDLTVFGYEDRVILFSEAKVDDGASGQIEVTAAADYLACRSACMPGEARLQRTIPVGAETVRAESDVLSALDRYDARVPRPASEYGLESEVAYSEKPLAHETDVEAALAIEACGEAENQCADWKPVWESRPHAFVPDEVSGAEVRVDEVREHPDAETGWVYHLSGTVRSADENIKEQLSGVVRFENADGTTIPVHVQEPLPIAEPGQEPEATDAELLEVSTPTISASVGKSTGGGGGGGPPSLVWILLMAFAGGAILNLMPCVFPVLALKVTSFNRTVRESRGNILAHGAAYTGGIVGSLLALGGVVIGLRVAGHQVGWGFQFQHPAFPAGLAAVVTLFALNLFGLFDVNLQSGGLQESTEEASGLRRSVGEGVLAVVLATPCSAPFLGTAVGFAFASNAFTILAVFATLGLGLAAPFVVLTLMPGWAKVLPKPGAWMGHLKHFLGFALVGTAGWLVWLVGRQAGVDAMASVLGLLIVVGLAAWIFGLVQYGSSTLRKWGWTAAAGMLVVGTAGWVFPLESGQAESSSRAAAASEQKSAVDWQKWSREAVHTHLDEGRPVFVDFTADWCLTCQVNEQNAITASSVLEAVDEHDVAMLKADWTDGSERIRKELQRHGRAGVPMYLVYSPDAPQDPELLPELLTTDHLTEAFEKAAGGDDE
jgi:thiol:disulfide interchange protein DsbD